MKTTIFKTLTFLSLFFLIFGCDKNDETPAGKFEKGIFITNEGAFSAGNASVSFYSTTGDSISNDIFFKANNRPLGDVLQSAIKLDDKTYLLLNGSNKIEIVNSSDFSELGVIESLDGPRYIVENGGKLYVSQWGDGGLIKIIDPETDEITSSVSVGTGPEKLLSNSFYVFVANSGGFGVDSTISIINASTNTVIKTLETGYNPMDFVIDINNNLWVLNAGSVIYDASWNAVGHYPSSLTKISIVSLEIIDQFTLFTDQHPSHLEISPNGESLYVGGGFGFQGIYKIETNDGLVPANPLINISAYGFNVNSILDEMYILEAPNFTDGGVFHRYTTSGLPIKSYTVGIGPNNAIF